MGLLLTYWNRTTEVEKFRELAKILDQPLRRETKPKSRRAKQLSAPERAALVADYEAGILVREIAKKFGVHRVTVSNIVEAASLAPRARGLAPDQVEEASKLYVAGQSLAKLGKRYGVHAETVRQALLGAGVRLRPRPGWPSS